MPQRLKEEEDEAGSDGGYVDGDDQGEFDELQDDASVLYVSIGPVSCNDSVLNVLNRFPGISHPTMETFEAVTLYGKGCLLSIIGPVFIISSCAEMVRDERINLKPKVRLVEFILIVRTGLIFVSVVPKRFVYDNDRHAGGLICCGR